MKAYLPKFDNGSHLHSVSAAEDSDSNNEDDDNQSTMTTSTTPELLLPHSVDYREVSLVAAGER